MLGTIKPRFGESGDVARVQANRRGALGRRPRRCRQIGANITRTICRRSDVGNKLRATTAEGLFAHTVAGTRRCGLCCVYGGPAADSVALVPASGASLPDISRHRRAAAADTIHGRNDLPDHWITKGSNLTELSRSMKAEQALAIAQGGDSARRPIRSDTHDRSESILRRWFAAGILVRGLWSPGETL
jgi:hypothetical protein